MTADNTIEGQRPLGAAGLRLRPLRLHDEAAFRRAHVAMKADDFELGIGFHDDTVWADYLDELERQRRGVDLGDHLVPATFLVADVDGDIVGRASIRHRLNDYLALLGGHIGYGVMSEHRRRGYATTILRQSLVIARAVGVERVLVTCLDTNIGSATVIERCGGVLQEVVSPDGERPTRRYWID